MLPQRKTMFRLNANPKTPTSIVEHQGFLTADVSNRRNLMLVNFRSLVYV